MPSRYGIYSKLDFVQNTNFFKPRHAYQIFFLSIYNMYTELADLKLIYLSLDGSKIKTASKHINP